MDPLPDLMTTYELARGDSEGSHTKLPLASLQAIPWMYAIGVGVGVEFSVVEAVSEAVDVGISVVARPDVVAAVVVAMLMKAVANVGVGVDDVVEPAVVVINGAA